MEPANPPNAIGYTCTDGRKAAAPRARQSDKADRSVTSTLNTLEHNVRSYGSLFACLTCFWAFHFVTLWSSAFAPHDPTANLDLSSDLIWIISVSCNALALAVFLGFISKLQALDYARFSLASCILTAFSIALMATRVPCDGREALNRASDRRPLPFDRRRSASGRQAARTETSGAHGARSITLLDMNPCAVGAAGQHDAVRARPPLLGKRLLALWHCMPCI